MTFSYSCAQYNEYMNLRGYKRPCRSYEHTHGHVSAHSCVHIPITCTQTVTCMHTAHKHSHITCVNSEHTSTLHAWTHNHTHSHTTHNAHKRVHHICSPIPYPPHVYTQHMNTSMYTHISHAHALTKCTHTTHVSYTYKPHTQAFPTPTYMHGHTTHVERERMNMSGNPGVVCLCIGGYVCPCMYVRVGNVCVSEWFVCIW